MTRNKASNLHEIQENGRWSGLQSSKVLRSFSHSTAIISIPSTKSTFTAIGGRTLRHGGALDVVFTCLD